MRIHNPSNLPLIDYRTVEPLQGELKDLTERNHDKLLNVLEKRGFKVPLFLWHNDGVYYLMDGHQRQRVMLKNDLNDGGSHDVPYVLIEADSVNEAKAQLLEITSQYGTITQEGYDSFSAELPEVELVDIHFDALPYLMGDGGGGGGGEGGASGSLAERFVVPPFSVLDTKQGYWQDRKDNWNMRIGDQGESREGALSKGDNYISTINGGVSILDPVLAEVIVKWWGLAGGHVYDPFAGDSVFGYVAASSGMVFTGTELRPEQAELNQQRVDAAELEATYICADAMDMDKHIADESQDLIFSCPPYADLEVYSDLPKDLSNMSHEDFYKVYSTVLTKTYAKLKPNRFAVITIGEVRNKKGEYISLVPKTIEIMLAAGYTYYNELILVNAIGTLPQRVGRFMRSRKIGKQHQNVLVFYKGSIKAIKDEYPEIEGLMEFTEVVADETAD